MTGEDDRRRRVSVEQDLPVVVERRPRHELAQQGDERRFRVALGGHVDELERPGGEVRSRHGRGHNDPRMSDPVMVEQPRTALVFGARNLGRAVVEALVGEGWRVAAAARSDATLEAIREAGALALRADVTDAASVESALGEVAEAYGPVGLVVNAAAAYGGDRSGPFGGGPLAQADPAAFDAWAAAPARSAFGFLSGAGRFLLSQAAPATLVQVTGGSARRAMPGRGLWAAGSFGVRALTHAARPRAARRGHPRGPAHHRRRYRTLVGRRAARSEPGSARRSSAAR